MNRYNTALKAITKLFDVNDDLRNTLNNLALEEHGKSLEELFIITAQTCEKLSEKEYSEYINYLNELNNEPHSISEMEELYSFVYNF